MKERAIDSERAVVAHDQTPEVSQPTDGAFHNPTPPISSQCATVLRRPTNAILFVRADQLDSPLPQSLAQRIAIVSFVGNTRSGFCRGRPARCLRPMWIAASVVSASRTSAGDAEQRSSPRGTPAPSTTTIHFVPLPRLVFPTP